MKKQVVVIHGGDSFETYEEYLKFLKDFEIDFKRYRSDKKDWKETLSGELGQEFEVIRPEMPNKRNAKYLEWKIWFEKFIPYLNSEIVLIGHSMGGVFLAKYLSENKIPKKIEAVFLVAAVFEKDLEGYSVGSFALPENLDLQTEKVYLYHSKDDPIVSFADMGKYKSKLKNAIVREFSDRGHFNREEFPELIRDIKNL